MSQIGNIISITPAIWNNQWNWSVMFSYALDAGGSQQGQVMVGPTVQPTAMGLSVNGEPAPILSATVALWSSPQATIAVPLNQTPGTTNQVLLPCPPLAATAIFNAVLK
jgi:hypothetical protein